MSEIRFRDGRQFAEEMDEKDPLRVFRERFLFPTSSAKESIYLVGNSLGLQPKKTREAIEEVLQSWASQGVQGHFAGKWSWGEYSENLLESIARIVGAYPSEVAIMNSLTVNLHLMMASFYQPRGDRFKILMEAGAFPSDQYAVASHVRFRGFDPKQAILELEPRPGEFTLRREDILKFIEEEGKQIALILMGNVNYLTGQAFDLEAITRLGHTKGCKVGFDLAHAVGNLSLKLHDWGPDFAVWCSYKYLNGGPGSPGGCFIHERHANDLDLHRLAGWWGQKKQIRFKMGRDFEPTPGARGWQLSNSPILSLAALRASLDIFNEIPFDELRKKSFQLTGYLEYLLGSLPSGYCTIVTPASKDERGAQLSLKIDKRGKLSAEKLEQKLLAAGVFCDFRQPDIIRVAPTPLYNSFRDVFRFSCILSEILDSQL